MERVFEPTEKERLIAAMVGVLTLPRATKEADALVVFHGMGETIRERSAIKVWETHGNSARVLLVAGKHPKEKGPIPDMNLLFYHLSRIRGVYCQGEAQNTLDQSQWVVDKVLNLGLTSIALFITPYHLFRAYLTLVSTLLHFNLWIPVIPIPAACGLDSFSPETGYQMRSMVTGEVRRIIKYQRRGDIAGFEILNEYLDWLWKQPILASLDPG